ncbi:hypothetical protein R5R35_000123 [Gryllus longicercus]|uniref:C-type lectin domain-containing protein n=1 Tax=Gryllus longicercus TaxID=2509291 RepID=A0AAN9YXE8_9ORTH
MEPQIMGVLTAALLVGVELVVSTEEQHASIALSLSHHTNASGHAILNGKLEQAAGAAWHLEVALRDACGATARSQVLTFGLTGPSARVPPGYALREGFGYFRAATHALSWTAARDACARDGAALAFAQSQEEAHMLATQFNFDVSGTHVKNLAWYGASDHAEEGNYVTVTGLTLGKTGYASFSQGTPHGGTERNCIYIMNSTGLLVDGFCKTPIAYICKVSL